MYIKKITLKNFRCFADRQFSIDGQFIFIQGNNGVGKTSLLEALHYGGHLRSFRSLQQNDLISFGADYFFIRIDLESHENERNSIYIGYSKQEGKQVKLNNQPITSHKELTSYIRVITVTADDIELVNGYPDRRRSFASQTLALQNHDYIQLFKKNNAILEQRNSKLFSLRVQHKQADDELMTWTQSFLQTTREIQDHYRTILINLESVVNKFLQDYFYGIEGDLQICLQYQARNLDITISDEDFLQNYPHTLQTGEIASGRSSFGIHLDDIIISFRKARARTFASRGQQKLIALLLKIAQAQQLLIAGKPVILLLDDFLTDFDTNRIKQCMALLSSLPCQIIITSPLMLDITQQLIIDHKAILIDL